MIYIIKKIYVKNIKNKLKITGKFFISGWINSVSKGEKWLGKYK